MFIYYDTSAISGPWWHEAKLAIIDAVEWATGGTSVVRYFIARLHSIRCHVYSWHK